MLTIDYAINHPNTDIVVGILSEIMRKKKYRSMRIDVISYDRMHQTYVIGFTWRNFFETIVLPVEMINDAYYDESHMPYTKIKFILRNSLRELRHAAIQSAELA